MSTAMVVHAPPWVTDGEFQIHGPVVQQHRFTLPAKRESLIGLTAQGAFERSGQIGVHVLQHHIEVFGGAGAIA